MNDNDLEAIGERLTRLEREVKNWKRAATAAMVLLAVLIAFSPTLRTREAGASGSSAQDLLVSRLRLVDPEGKVRGGLGVTKDGPALALFDGKGSSAILAASKDGAHLDLEDERGSANLGTETLLVNDEKKTNRVSLGGR